MITKDEVLSLLRTELPYLEKNFFVKKIGLFGSFARGEETEESDIDLLVEFEKSIGFFTLFEFEDYLTDKLGTIVEIVTPNGIKEFIRPKIMSDVIYV